MVLLLLGSQLLCFGQDPQFSQYYGAALYHNPAFTGTSTPQRITLHHRIQWPGLPAPYVSTALGVDHLIQKTGTGIGALVSQDIAGVSRFRTLTAAGIVSQRLPVTSTVNTNLSVQVGVEQRDIDAFSLIYPDQVTPDGLVAATQEPAKANRAFYTNVALGALVYTNYWWVGFSLHNMNQPSIEPLGQRGGILLARTSVMGGLRFPLQDERYLKPWQKADAIIPTVMYRAQGSVQQVDFGVQAELGDLILGVNARGIPFLGGTRGVFTQDAIVGMFGVYISGLRFCYSYDFNYGQWTALQGAHEVGIVWGFNAKNLLRRSSPCPGM